MNTPNNQIKPIDFAFDFDLLFTGAPQNQETIPTNGDPDKYLSQFFNNPKSDHDVDYVVEVLPSKQTVYYTYLLRHQVDGYSRKGSYFGISLRLIDAFCIDIQGIYHLLDKIFNEHIRGTILTPNSAHSWKYLQPSLSNADPMRQTLEQELFEEFTKGLWCCSLQPFNAGDFVAKAPSPITMALEDSPNENLLQVLKTSSYCLNFYPQSEKTNYYQTLWQQSDQECKNLKNNLQLNIDKATQPLRKQVDELKTQLSEKDKQLLALQNQVKTLNQSLKNHTDNDPKNAVPTLKSEVAQLKQWCEQLAQRTSKLESDLTPLLPKPNPPKTTLNQKQLLIIAGAVLLVIILAIGAINLLKKPKPTPEQSTTENTDQRQSRADSLQQKNTVDSSEINTSGAATPSPVLDQPVPDKKKK